MRVLGCLLLLVTSVVASTDVVNRASALYQRTEYQNSLRLLAQDPAPDAATWLLIGKNHFGMADYKKATEYFEKAIAAAPGNAECELWLGRAWGRRAESSSLMAVVYATRARQSFEKAAALDPRNGEAKNDLFDFYLNAPGFLGGGLDKAQAAARAIATERPAEYEFEEAEIAEKRNDFASAEAHLRRAMELAPKDAGRIVDLARFVAKHGRPDEGDRLFEEARRIAQNKPSVLFAEAKSYIDNHRKLDEARKLLQSYLQASLTPDDPTRQEAEKLLKKTTGS